MLSVEELRERIAPGLPSGLLAHIERVVALARELASMHGLDVERAAYMAQAHDVVRHLSEQEWLQRAEAAGLEIDAVERANPVLLHGPLGAIELRERLGVTDEGVLHAVRWHTPGHIDYSAEAWAMFVADKVEPRKVEEWPALERVREAARGSLEAAALLYLDLALGKALEQRWQIHPAMVRTRNALIERGVVAE